MNLSQRKKALALAGGSILAAVIGMLIFAPVSGTLWLLTAASVATEAPSYLLAYARGDAEACDFGAYSASVRMAGLERERILMIRASKLKKTDGSLEEWDTPVGTFWKPRTTDLFFVLAEQKVDVYESGEHHVEKGDIVLDAGANVGTFTRKALDRGASLVVAIEPSPYNAESLTRTFAKEIEQGRVIVLPKGVWHEESTMTMTLYEDSALDSFVMANRTEQMAVTTGEVELPLTTVDHLVADLGLPRVDFIKMDIEGAERNALEGARQTIQKFRPRLSIATENLEDDYLVLPDLIAETEPAYIAQCGACRLVAFGAARPDIMFFHAD